MALMVSAMDLDQNFLLLCPLVCSVHLLSLRSGVSIQELLPFSSLLKQITPTVIEALLLMIQIVILSRVQS